MSKARTLEFLRGKLKNAAVPSLFIISRSQWANQRKDIEDECRRFFPKRGLFIVRSSATDEDVTAGGTAGKYLSVPNIEMNAVPRAIEDVFKSYRDVLDTDEVFVQRMIEDCELVAVAFHPDPSTGCPYLIVNYAEHEDTDAITSGKGNHKTWFSTGKQETEPPHPFLAKIPDLIDEIKTLLQYQNVDLEFVVRNKKLFLLQCRRLAVRDIGIERRIFVDQLEECQKQFDRCQETKPSVLGKFNILGVMPDWNPAEIIGVRPKPLAMSLYRRLVTDRQWSIQRSEYGYRKLTGVELLVEIGGQPYIDVRASFNSFLPASLDEETGEKIIEGALERLAKYPQFHDKVEFKIIPTCFGFDTIENYSNWYPNVLNAFELSRYMEQLKDLTFNIIRQHEQIRKSEDAKLDKVKQGLSNIAKNVSGEIEKFSQLVALCEIQGVAPFVGQARRAFIATELLRSFERNGIISVGSVKRFFLSLNTVTRQFQTDQFNITYEKLMEKYGHLRPGTYDIRSLRYDEMERENFQARPENRVINKPMAFALTDKEATAIENFFSSSGPEITSEEFLSFSKESIESRERGKFIFTRCLSDALNELTKYGNKNRLSREDLSHLKVEEIENILKNERSYEEISKATNNGRNEYTKTVSLNLPPLISNRDQIFSFLNVQGQPNFVGSDCVAASIVCLNTGKEICGRIVFVESADPGYDWILTRGIVGFVTMYGGANSHMAIRAQELQMTAVIGAGSVLYKRWLGYDRVRIDPLNLKVERVLN